MGDALTSTQLSNFKWLTDEEMKDLHVMMTPDDSSRGYILERDLVSIVSILPMFMYIL